MANKYRLGSVTIEAVGTFVRVCTSIKTQVTKKECPKPIEIASMLFEMQGYWPNNAQLQACGRAADDARLNRETGR